MTPSPRTIGPDALAVEALLTMNVHERPVASPRIVDTAGKHPGILHVRGLLHMGIA